MYVVVAVPCPTNTCTRFFANIAVSLTVVGGVCIAGGTKFFFTCARYYNTPFVGYATPKGEGIDDWGKSIPPTPSTKSRVCI